MLDPFPIPPPPTLVRLVKPWADKLHLTTLPLHFHEVIFAALFYTFTCNTVSPFISARIAPKTYPRLSRRSKLNWDVHIVSFVQAIIINGISLWIIWFDEERKVWRSNDEGLWAMRIWGYYGSGGLCQSFALGYFLWDLVMCSTHVDIFGWGMLAHAMSAVAVFGLGYRPFIYFSAPIFLLYELSSPFLNIHWFCDKLHLTGSIYQAINGAFLVGTFFGCRLVWGIYSSCWVFRDMFWLWQAGHMSYTLRVGAADKRQAILSVEELMAVSKDAKGQLNAFNQERYIPVWIPLIYLLSNLVLNSLNIFWFGKMIQTIRTRFEPPFGTKGIGPDKIAYQPAQYEDDSNSEDSDLGMGEPGKHKGRDRSASEVIMDGVEGLRHEYEGKGSVGAARRKAEEALNGPVGRVTDTRMEKTEGEDGTTGIEVEGTQRRSARSRRKA